MARAGGRISRADAGHDGDHQHVADGRDDARHKGGQEELGDVLLGQDRINHQGHRGRDENAQGSARSKGGGGKAAGVFVRLEFGQSHLTHGGGGGQRGAADRAKAGAGGYAGHGHAPAPVANEGVARLKQRAREPAVGGKLPHQQEQRHH